MHKEIDKIRELEGPIKIVKNLFSKTEIDKFLELYNKLPTTVHNKKQNVIKKRILKSLLIFDIYQQYHKDGSKT